MGSQRHHLIRGLRAGGQRGLVHPTQKGYEWCALTRPSHVGARRLPPHKAVADHTRHEVATPPVPLRYGGKVRGGGELRAGYQLMVIHRRRLPIGGFFW